MFQIPSLADSVARARAAFRAYLPGSDAWLWPNNIGPSAKVIGGSAWEIYNRLDYVQRAKFALTAVDGDLDMHGAEFNLPRKLAQPASGNMVITCTAAMSIAAGAQFQRLDGVVVTASNSGSATAAGSFNIDVIAATPAAAANSQGGTSFSIISGASGPGAASATAVVDSSGLMGGLDIEPDGVPFTSDLATYRGRILFRKRNPPMGGSPADYVVWANAIPGVTRVFVERRWNGPGTVRVFPLFDELFASAGGVGDSGHIALVDAALQAEAPAGCQVTTQAPTGQPINVAISALLPNTSAAQAAVTAELADTIQRLGRVAGSDPGVASLPFLAKAFTFPDLWISQAIANANGVISADLTSPSSDDVIAAAAIPTPGTVVFS